VTGSEATSIAYATVYPLTMILRIFAAQLLVILLFNS
jgi:putative transport protein